MGSTNTIGGEMGHPRIDSNQMPMIQSLHRSSLNKSHNKKDKVFTETDIDGSSGEQSMRTQLDR
jgi:hypothetical protein